MSELEKTILDLIELEDKFRAGQIDEREYRTTKEKYQSILSKNETAHIEMNYSSDLSLFGFLMGGWIGYLLRPSILGMQLSIKQTLNFINSNDPMAEPLKNMAWISIEFIITGAILGTVVGWTVGKLIKR